MNAKIDAHAAIERAAQLLLAIGFREHSRSRATESLYFNWPGRTQTLRLSTHRLSRKNSDSSDWPLIAARLTLPESILETKLERAIATAIGMYFIKSAR